MAAPHTRPALAGVVVLIAVMGLALWIRPSRIRPPAGDGVNVTDQVDPKLVSQLTALEAREKQADETVWAKDLLAGECGLTFDHLWDSLNRTTNKLAVAANWLAAEIIPPRWGPPRTVAPEIQVRESEGVAAPWNTNQWRALLGDLESAGWQLAQMEFRHVRFDTDLAGRPAQSRFYFSAHLTNSQRLERAALEGELVVDWSAERDPDGLWLVRKIDASQLTLKMRRGEPPFRLIFEAAFTPPPGSWFIDPLILHDLDGDGLSEIVLASKNLVLRLQPDGRFESSPLCRDDPGVIFTGAIADFTGDGAVDFLCAKFKGLYLHEGSPGGRFEKPARQVWQANPHLKYAQALTWGDVDADGDLDVWLGQYKVPYTRGQMPTPFHDANDGSPAYLLLNDGRGGFSDATESSGLAGKRWRRTYSGSLVDLDRDGDLDLVVVSDFAGTDLYQNDGRGRFTDVTGRWLDEPHAAGMAHAISDFDRDGLADLLVIGMTSPTADRMAHLKLSRPGFTNDAAMRAALMHGNRLYLGRPDGGFRQGVLSDGIARSGWSWGTSAFDFDNDGYPDVYVANGHESKESVRDYDPEVWRHDVYVGSSHDDLAAMAYFGGKMARTRGRGHSYGGYEKNRLYLNQRGTNFFEAAHLMGVALEPDCRNVVTDDLDGDGRVDLLVTTFEAWPETKQTLRIYRNTTPATGNWIGIRLREDGGGTSPVGAQVTLRSNGGRVTQSIMTGHSFRSQHANTVHFGLGRMESVDRVEVRWPDGRAVELRQPEINRYHDVTQPRGR